jgi:hypothetical protein
MTPDIPSLIHKLRNAPQLVGTFGRGDPDPLGQYRLVMTDEERNTIIELLTAAHNGEIRGWRAQTESMPKDPWEAALGCAPDATGELSSEDFIRKMRDEEWG